MSSDYQNHGAGSSHTHAMQNDSESQYMSGDDSDDGGNAKKGKGKGSSKEDKEKRGAINRVSRACNHCRRMKMRCIGAEDPPCKRCRNSGLECKMEKPGKPADHNGDDRIRSLESQVTSIQSTLTELVSTLRAGIGQPPGRAPSHPPHTTTPDFPPPAGTVSSLSMLSNNSPNTFDVSGYHGTSAGSGPTPPFFNPQTQQFLPQPSPNHVRFAPQAPGDIQWNQYGQGQGGSDGNTSPFNTVPIDPSLMASGAMSSQHNQPKGQMSGQVSGQGQNQGQSQSQSQQYGWNNNDHDQRVVDATNFQSLPTSRGGSETPDDILAPEEIINPLGSMSTMAGAVEAAVKQSKTGGGEGGKRGNDAQDGALPGRPAKKSRQSPILPHGPVIREAQNLPPQSSKDRVKKAGKKTHIHAYPDIVEEGLITEQEGRELMAIFYAGSSNFIPCYDPQYDTWDSLRVRSPFSITAIIMAGARVRDGGGPISDVQRLAREHAQRIAVGTLFNPVARVEAVQAMIILAAFSENGWLPGGHAVRMAIDMGLNRSFLHLLRTGIGKGKTPEQLEEERYLVVQSRIWFCLYLIEHQMAYGMGRPAILREDDTIHQCRRLLEHPMSITSDARLVATVELMALRAPLHIELTASPDLPITETTMRRLKQANADFDAWERYWDRVLGDRFGKGRGDFFRESLIIQRQYAELFVNSQLLRGIKEPTDVVNMPEEKRALAIRAMRNAQKCIEICLQGENYRNGLRYAVHYTHVCAAFAASFLIRIARLFPHELNLKRTAKDVDELANVLSEVPAGRYARSLRLILRRARRAKVIPAASRPGSPAKGANSLPSLTAFKDTSKANASIAKEPFSPSQLVNPSFLPTPTATTGLTPQQQHMGFTPTQATGPGSAAVGAGGLPGNMAQMFNTNAVQGQGQGQSLVPGQGQMQGQQGAIVDDSPSSAADFFEFDQLFAQETMERAGLTQRDGDQLPLFLDGHSLGGGQNVSEFAPFVGMEQFFLPPALDNRLGGPSAVEQNQGALGGFDPNLLAEEIWW